MSGGNDERHDRPVPADYEVGYGKPPREHRFQPGRSGNPKERPKRAKASGDPAPRDRQAEAVLLAEAYREVTLREGDKHVRLSMLEAVYRAMAMSALKGNRFAQTNLINSVRAIEHERYRERIAHLEQAISYKTYRESEIANARAQRRPEPVPLPHPDDMVVDLERGEVRYSGPRDPDELAVCQQLAAEREKLIAAGRVLNASGDAAKDERLGSMRDELKRIDARLPARFRKTP